MGVFVFMVEGVKTVFKKECGERVKFIDGVGG